jgi:hypothetical protein
LTLTQFKDQIPFGNSEPLVVAAIPAFNEERNIEASVGDAEIC